MARARRNKIRSQTQALDGNTTTMNMNMNNPTELPSLEEITAMDRKREEAIQQLQYSKDKKSVKCQLDLS
jgi:hypothetical protein